MPRTKVERMAGVSAAAAHDFNEELTILMSGMRQLTRRIGSGDRDWLLMCELNAAVQRCAWKSTGLLHFSGAKGARPSFATLEKTAEHFDAQ